MADRTQDTPDTAKFSALDLDLAPEVPGIYAWYARVPLGADDWRPDLGGGNVAASKFVLDAIEQYADIHRSTPLNIRADGDYDLRWEGTLARKSISDKDESRGVSEIENQLYDKLTNETFRRNMVAMMRLAPPVFASPLYIGVATNLRSRLSQHRDAYEKAAERIRIEPDSARKFRESGENFGQRLAGAGVGLDQLDCWILSIGNTDGHGMPESSNPGREVSRATEWSLQRVFLPVLGRK